MRYALVNGDGIVVNVIALDDLSQYTPDAGLHLVIDDQATALTGGRCDGNLFTAPPEQPAVEQKKSDSERIAHLEAKLLELAAKVDGDKAKETTK